MRSSFIISIVILLSAGSFLFKACTSAKNEKEKKEGVIENQTVFNTTKPGSFFPTYTSIKFRCWFKGDLGIKEYRILYLKTDTAGKATQDYKLIGYLFENRISGMVSEYFNFSDTAKPVKVFAITDSVALSGGGYYLPFSKGGLLPASKSYYMSDTLINKINFKRLVQNVSIRSDTVVDIYFLRKGISKFLLNMYGPNDSINNLSDYKIVKVIRKPSLQSEIFAESLEVNIIADELTSEQRKVFDTWEKNEKTYK